MIQDTLIPVVAIVTLFGGAYVCIYFWLKTRNQQRLLLLEKGLDRDIFSQGSSASRLRRRGALLIGVGAGLLAGYVIAGMLGVEPWVAYAACISLTSGCAIFAAMRTETGGEPG